MIFDNIKNVECYKGFSTNLDKAIDFLAKGNFDFDGQYEVDGRNVYAFKDTYQTKAFSEIKAESHEKYIDIQVVLKGIEQIPVLSKEECQETVPYNPDKDITRYDFDGTTKAYPTFLDGDFMVIFPHEVHAPKALVGKSSTVEKLVVKIKI